MNIQEQMRWYRHSPPEWYRRLMTCNFSDTHYRPKISVIWGTIEEAQVRPVLERKLKALEEMQHKSPVKELQHLVENPIVWTQQLGRVKRRVIVGEWNGESTNSPGFVVESAKA